MLHTRSPQLDPWSGANFTWSLNMFELIGHIKQLLSAQNMHVTESHQSAKMLSDILLHCPGDTGIALTNLLKNRHVTRHLAKLWQGLPFIDSQYLQTAPTQLAPLMLLVIQAVLSNQKNPISWRTLPPTAAGYLCFRLWPACYSTSHIAQMWSTIGRMLAYRWQLHKFNSQRINSALCKWMLLTDIGGQAVPVPMAQYWLWERGFDGTS